MFQSDDLNRLVNDKHYIEVTAAIAKSINTPTSDEFPIALKNICLEDLRISSCSPQQLLDCLQNDTGEVTSFSVKKWKFLEGVEDQQEYPEGEDVDEDDADEVLGVKPITPAFLLGRLCEFYLLKYKGEAELSAYLKKLRIPGLKKYVQDLKRIFNETQSQL